MKQAIKHGKNHLPGAVLLAILTCVLSFSTAFAQQGGLSRYVYDDNGRLHAVISPTGEAAIYEYDPAGNITAIRRNTTATLEVLDFSPREGVPGNQVTIVGTGFGAGVNSVTFNGATAQIVSTNAPVIVVTVPNDATTGPISVTTPGGTATTAIPFTIRGISVAPAMATIQSQQTVQFTATVVPAGSFVWKVEGIEGGSSIVGTITAAGLYTAPKLPFYKSSMVFHVWATSSSDASVFGEALVTVKNLDFLRPVFTQAISVRNGSLSGLNAAPTFSAAVSVRNGNLSGGNAASSFSPLVTVTQGPSITAISPVQVPRGTSTNITISGANLSSATTLSFTNFADGATDTTITAANINVNGGGTSLTATLTINSGASLGQRVVVVTAAGKTSTNTNIGSNMIQVIP